MNNWFSRHLDCPDKGFAFSSHPMTCFVLRHHVDGVHTVVHPCCASPKWNRLGMLWPWTWGCGGWQIVTYIFLPLTHPHLGCLETPPSTLFKMLPFSPVFTQGTPYLGDPPRSKWHFESFCVTGSSQEIASSKKIITFRKVLPPKCNLTLWMPLQNSRGPEVTNWKMPIFQVSGKCNFI